jgi:hypothetical protein
MKALCFALYACAFNLLIGYGGLLSFGHAMFLGVAGYASRTRRRTGASRPSSAILFATALSALLGLVSGLIAIRRQGIYFAMITLALSQMIFLLLPAGDVDHRGRGRHPGRAARQDVRRARSLEHAGALFRRAGDIPRRVPADPPDHQLAVRQRAEDDPRQRAAGDFARVRRRALQASRLRAFRDADRARGREPRRSSSSSLR